MKNKLFTNVVLTFLLIIMSCGTALAESMSSNDLNNFNPKFVNSDVSTKINDIYEHRIGDLSIETVNSPIDNYDFMFFTEFHENQFGNTEFLDITIPKITAFSESGKEMKGVNVIFMAITPSTNDYITETQQINSDNHSVILTRDDVQKWSDKNNNGEFPHVIKVLIQFNENGYSDYDDEGNYIKWSDPVSSVIFHDDVIIRQRVVEKATTSTEKGFSALVVDVSASYERNYDSEPIRLNSYMFLETSDISVSYDEDKSYKPGDEIELNISIKNESKLANKLSLWLQADGLEIMDVEENMNLNWGIFDSGFVANMVDEENKFMLLNPGKEINFTQTFRIANDYEGESITIMPSLKAGFADYGWDADDVTVIPVKQEEEPKSEIPNSPKDEEPEETPNVPNDNQNKEPSKDPNKNQEEKVEKKPTTINKENGSEDSVKQLPNTGKSSTVLISALGMIFLGILVKKNNTL